uniref:Glucanase n=1 Tax=Coniophora puteana TaxID=80637 RepID=C4B8I1_9AGAM|nr:cellulase [Coniophora puteana]
MFKFAALSAFVALVPLLVNAQVAAYGQCGGQDWTGATACASGTACTKVNDYYYQCLPGSSGSSVSGGSGSGSTSAPSPTSTVPTSTSSASTAPSSTSTSSAASSDNPYTGYQIFLNPEYASEVQAAIPSITDSAVAAKALKVAEVPVFFWLDQVAKVPDLETYLAAADKQGKSSGQKQLLQIVVYDLPDRDCAANASNGEFSISDDGQAKYENYIDQIVAIVKKYPDVRVVAVVEPDSMGNLVTNMDLPKCSAAAPTYKTCINYAIAQLSSAGVYMYVDAGHAGWLGWPNNLAPAAQLFGELYETSGKSAYFRGLATNVANYNALNTSSPDPCTQNAPNYDEMLYINALSPLLQQQGFSAQFIVDQGRSGVQNIRNAWGDWCNIKGAGFGIRPTTDTGSPLIDSIVWVKPGGECDGTSNSSAPRYDSTCSLSDSLQPAPEAGTWFQQYFEALVTNAVPSL